MQAPPLPLPEGEVDARPEGRAAVRLAHIERVDADCSVKSNFWRLTRDDRDARR